MTGPREPRDYLAEGSMLGAASRRVAAIRDPVFWYAMALLAAATALQWPLLGVPVAIAAMLALYVAAFAAAVPEARALGLLLSGAPLVNFVFHSVEIHGAGFFVLIPLSGVLLVPRWRVLARVGRAVPRWVLLTGLGLILWWCAAWVSGPKTEWATLKLLASAGRLLVGTAALVLALVGSRRGLLDAALMALAAAGFQFAMNCETVPASAFALGSWGFPSDVTGMSASRAVGLGVLLALSYAALRWPQGKVTALAVGMLACAAPCVVAGDTRQVIAGVPLGALFLPMLKGPRRRAVAAVLLVVTAAGLLVAYGVSTGQSRFATMLDDEMSYAERSGRYESWEEGLTVAAEHPVLGVGLGGYYADSPHFGRGYPHNLAIELLSETGMVGAALAAAFLAACVVAIGRHPGYGRSAIFQLLLPGWVYSVAISMVSLDLPANTEVLYLPAAAAVSMAFLADAARQPAPV